MGQEKKFFLFIFIVLITAGILSLLGNVAIMILMPHFVIFYLAIFFLFEKNLSFTLNKIGIPGDTKKNIIYAIIGLTAIVVTQILTSIVLSSPSAEEDIKQVYDIIKQFPTYILIFAVFFAPISEELFFRALLVGKLSKRFGTTIGIVAPAVLFALVHIGYGSYIQILVTFFVGIILGYIYKKSNSILPGIIAHMVSNALSILISTGM